MDKVNFLRENQYLFDSRSFDDSVGKSGDPIIKIDDTIESDEEQQTDDLSSTRMHNKKNITRQSINLSTIGNGFRNNIIASDKDIVLLDSEENSSDDSEDLQFFTPAANRTNIKHQTLSDFDNLVKRTPNAAGSLISRPLRINETNFSKDKENNNKNNDKINSNDKNTSKKLFVNDSQEKSQLNNLSNLTNKSTDNSIEITAVENSKQQNKSKHNRSSTLSQKISKKFADISLYTSENTQDENITETSKSYSNRKSYYREPAPSLINNSDEGLTSAESNQNEESSELVQLSKSGSKKSSFTREAEEYEEEILQSSKKKSNKLTINDKKENDEELVELSNVKESNKPVLNIANVEEDDDEEFVRLTKKGTKKMVLKDDDDSYSKEIKPSVSDLKHDFSELSLFSTERSNKSTITKSKEDSIQEILISSEDEAVNPKPLQFKNVKKEQQPVASWSPNFDYEKKLEAAKSRVKVKLSEHDKNVRKLELISLDDQSNQSAAKNAYENLKFDARVIRGPNQQITNRNLSFEESLKILREEMFEALERKPDRDESYEHLGTQKNLKVSLLPHQCYSMEWFKWRERTYPNGGILADDMGLGKTLTVLAYLNSVKIEREKEKKKKTGLENEEEDEDDNYDGDDLKFKQRKANFKSKFSSHKETTKRLRTLIVVPASLLLQWEGEIKSKFTESTFKYYMYHGDNRKKYAYNLSDYDIVFTTYEIISREIEVIEGKANDSPLARIKWKRVILDEAHRIKNHNTKANKTMCLLKAKYRFALTGTPIHNSINDLYSLVKFIAFQPLDEFKLWNYLFASEKFGASKGKVSSANAVERTKRLDSWLVFLSDYLILRRTKNDKFKDTQERIVKLPEKSIEVIRFKLNSEESSIYKQIFDESKESVKEFLADRQQRLIGNKGSSGSSRVTEILLYLLRLRQACCHMSLLEECLDKNELQNMKVEVQGIEDAMESMNLKDESTMSQSNSVSNLSAVQKFKSDQNLTGLLKKSYLSSKIDMAINMIDELVEEYPDDKIIIVSQWTTMLGLIAGNLDKRDIEYCQISGDVNLARRNEIVVDFNNQKNSSLKVMLLSLTAGGVGLNLVGANRMFLLDIHWNPALEQQCSDRIYRVGQKKNVTIYRLICEKTIEERIEQVQQHKIELAQKVCGDKGFNVGGGVTSAKLTINDFKLLFTDFPDKN